MLPYLLTVRFITQDPLIFFHGGQFIHALEKVNKSLSDFYAFNLETDVWKKLFIMDGPCARDKHGMVKLADKLYIYGGNISPENLSLDDLWCFDFESLSWLNKGNEVVGAVIEKVEIRSATRPGKLAGLKLSPVAEHSFLLFGGINDSRQTQNLIYIFNA